VPGRLLIIDAGDPEASANLGDLLVHGSWQVERRALEQVRPHDLRRSGSLIVAVALSQANRATQLWDWLRHNPIPTPALAVLPETVDGETLRIATQAVDDFVLWPVRAEEIHFRVTRLLGGFVPDTELAGGGNEEPARPTDLIGGDPRFSEALRQLPAFGKSEAPVLITGETGTGKEMCARAIHHLGSRRDRPFIPVDCASIPENLFENELFGHARGAYTHAQSDQRGLVALAEGGTLLLDEIDTIPVTVQAKLLRFLQEHNYKPLGAERFARSDVRIIAATNRSIEERLRDGRFRADLYFRLNVLRLELPPLRDRRGDIAPLARHFLSLLNGPGGSSKSFTPAVLEKLWSYEWPGNIRELFNIVQRALVLSTGSQILPCHICLPAVETHEENLHSGFREARLRNIQTFERHYVEDILRRNQGNITRAARAARKDRRAFGRLVKKYDIKCDRIDPVDG